MRYKIIFHIDNDDMDFFTTIISPFSVATSYISLTYATLVLHRFMNSKLIPDVIFPDLKRQAINGKKFLSKLKSIALLQDIPVIILSSSSDTYTTYQLKNNVFTDFFTKPSDKKELINLLRPYLI